MNTEKAYGYIAQYLLLKIDRSDWDSLVMEADIIGEGASKILCWRYLGEIKEPGKRKIPFPPPFDINDALWFLVNNIEQTSGQRPWSLTFTLLPENKFNLEYSYDKPDWIVD